MSGRLKKRNRRGDEGVYDPDGVHATAMAEILRQEYLTAAGKGSRNERRVIESDPEASAKGQSIECGAVGHWGATPGPHRLDIREQLIVFDVRELPDDIMGELVQDLRD